MVPLDGCESLADSAQQCLEAAARYAYSLQRPDGHWYEELRSNISFTAQYVCLREIVGPSLRSTPDGPEFRRWLLGQQSPNDGSWSLAPKYAGDLSISVEGYLALKLLGQRADDPVMRRARDFIVAHGGIPKVGIITQFVLAIFGLVAWDEIAQVPAELMLMPTWSPINMFAFAHWSRVTATAMMVLRHHRPVFSLPTQLASPGQGFLDELYPDLHDRRLKFYPSLTELLYQGHYGRFVASMADKAVGVFEPIIKRTPIRSHSLSRCLEFMLERQTEGGYACFWPANFNCILALYCQGYSFRDKTIQRLLQAIDGIYLWKDQSGMRNQVTCGPSWDTALMAVGLCEAGLDDERLDKTIDWFKSTQILDVRGDYAVQAMHVPPGGWAFQYNNDWYPDTDDTITIVLAILLRDPSQLGSECVVRALQWIVGMQCTSGGWGCYDIDNENYFLNLFPFGQGNEFFDAPVPDVTARILECLGLVLQLLNQEPSLLKTVHLKQPLLPAELVARIRLACARAIDYLAAAQDARTGAWKSRWHANYINGTGSALQALAYFNNDDDDERVPHMIRRGLAWLRAAQNADGGWGETLHTYRDATLAGKGDSTPSQTAWALAALLSHVAPSDAAVERGVAHLVATSQPQQQRGCPAGGEEVASDVGRTWAQEQYVSVAFPNITWLDYTSTRHAYPMMALGRYVRKVKGLETKGM